MAGPIAGGYGQRPKSPSLLVTNLAPALAALGFRALKGAARKGYESNTLRGRIFSYNPALQRYAMG
jgi:hypothetical protein